MSDLTLISSVKGNKQFLTWYANGNITLVTNERVNLPYSDGLLLNRNKFFEYTILGAMSFGTTVPPGLASLRIASYLYPIRDINAPSVASSSWFANNTTGIGSPTLLGFGTDNKKSCFLFLDVFAQTNGVTIVDKSSISVGFVIS